MHSILNIKQPIPNTGMAIHASAKKILPVKKVLPVEAIRQKQRNSNDKNRK